MKTDAEKKQIIKEIFEATPALYKESLESILASTKLNMSEDGKSVIYTESVFGKEIKNNLK
jgi:hypothetical protein